MSFSLQDEKFMHQALALARKGIALASPNPCVGTVIIDKDGKTVGEAFHTYEKQEHAESMALAQAGERAHGGTAYVTLEPCSHLGRTGPCVDSLVAAGIKKVVAAMPDPNPLVNGKGFERLQMANVKVEIGVCEKEARYLNESFAKYIRTKTPLVVLKAGMTLDGKIAPPPGESDQVSALGARGATGGWITSTQARAHVQELRHAADAILVGVGTVIADDPLLTDRTGRQRRRPLLRVIVDSRLRLPLESRLAKTAKQDVVVFCSFAEEKRKRELESAGIQVQQIPLGAPDGRPDFRSIIAKLGAMEITSLIIEGGALVNWTALATGIVDKVFLYYAPKILAGTGSVPFAAGAGFRRISDAALVKNISVYRFGEDFAVEGYLRDPYEGIRSNHDVYRVN